MSSADNYDDVLGQLRAIGLEVDTLEIGRLTRCRTADDKGRQRTGWYSLHEIRTGKGALLLVGAFGDWRQGISEKVDLKRRELTTDERAAIRARIDTERRANEARREREAARAAERARRGWDKCGATWLPPSEGSVPIGSNAYLTTKGVGAHGVRFSARGNLVIPLHDVHGTVHGLQIIYADPEVKRRKGRDKDYWPAGITKRGHFFLIGTPTWLVLVAEGYATAASLHEATGFPVAVAFDAGNVLAVAQALKRRYRGARILVCADDDWLGRCKACSKLTPVADPVCKHCGEPHGKTNAGAAAASMAALAVSGSSIAPAFADRGDRKLTDFNDLHREEGLHVVRIQVEAWLATLGWKAGTAAPNTADGDRGALKPIVTADELFRRFALVYGHGGSVFDFQERMLLSLDDMRNACTHRETHRRWMESPDKKLVRIREVGFDPGGADPEITCNLWGGWPTKPKAGACELLLEMLEHLCSHEANAREIYDWVLKWLAYPIQHPGAKMKTALVLHGPQGAGKNLFFESIMAIYGEYGRIVDQSAIEDKFNDWASKKLYLIADEVVARQELFHTKNKLKGLITSDWIRINPKNVSAYDERNHANIVFLSNETQPLVLERDDRRYAVIWTPAELSMAFYAEVKAEVVAGGVEALHDYLLNLDLKDFAPHTRPPMTDSKRELIEISMDNTERFGRAWVDKEIEDIPLVPARSIDVYQLYRAWSARSGYHKCATEPKFVAEVAKRVGIKRAHGWYMPAGGTKAKQARFLFPPGVEKPDDVTQQVWLGDCVREFQTAIEAWKER